MTLFQELLVEILCIISDDEVAGLKGRTLN